MIRALFNNGGLIGSNFVTGHAPREITITSFGTRYESWIHLRTVRVQRVFASWVDTVYDVYETVTFIYVALSSRWVTTKVATESIVYYLRFTIDRAITKSLLVACILNGMSSGASIRKYSIRGRFIGRERTVHVLYMHRIYGCRNFYPTYHTFFIFLASSFFPFFFFPASFYLFKCGISYKSLMLHPLLSKLLPMFINFSPFLPRKSNVY